MDLNIYAVKKNLSAVISCQSAVKLDLQKLQNLTLSVHRQVVKNQLSLTLFNSNLKKVQYKAPDKFSRFEFKFFVSAETWHKS